MMLSKEEQDKLIKKTDETYITKEQLLQIISSLEFKKVKSARIDFVTDYIIKYNRDDEPYVQALGFDINID